MQQSTVITLAKWGTGIEPSAHLQPRHGSHHSVMRDRLKLMLRLDDGLLMLLSPRYEGLDWNCRFRHGAEASSVTILKGYEGLIETANIVLAAYRDSSQFSLWGTGLKSLANVSEVVAPSTGHNSLAMRDWNRLRLLPHPAWFMSVTLAARGPGLKLWLTRFAWPRPHPESQFPAMRDWIETYQ